MKLDGAISLILWLLLGSLVACLVVAFAANTTTAAVVEKARELSEENAKLRGQIAAIENTQPNVRIYRALNSGDVQVLVNGHLFVFQGVCPVQSSIF